MKIFVVNIVITYNNIIKFKIIYKSREWQQQLLKLDENIIKELDDKQKNIYVVHIKKINGNCLLFKKIRNNLILKYCPNMYLVFLCNIFLGSNLNILKHLNAINNNNN